jgi:hypothetical protein
MLNALLDKGTTDFFRDANNNPVLLDYQIKGFLKHSGKVHNGEHGVKALRSKIDDLVFPRPRVIKLNVVGKEGTCVRPILAETPKGPRTGIARSIELLEGTSFECDIKVKGSQITEALLRELLDYGEDMGIGQWRNGGHGRFHYELVKTKVEGQTKEEAAEEAAAEAAKAA